MIKLRYLKKNPWQFYKLEKFGNHFDSDNYAQNTTGAVAKIKK